MLEDSILKVGLDFKSIDFILYILFEYIVINVLFSKNY